MPLAVTLAAAVHVHWLQVQLQTSWPSQEDLFDTQRDNSPLVALYRSHIAAALNRHAPSVAIDRRCACVWAAPAAADQAAARASV